MTYQPDIALTDGTWRPVRGIVRWFPHPTLLHAAAPDPFNPHETACRCGATVTTTCRTKTGHRTKDHTGRKPRVCICGAAVGWKQQFCEDCCRANRAAAYRGYDGRRAVA